MFNRKILIIINALSNDKNSGFNMAVVGTVFTKEADYVTPFLKLGSAVKDPMLAFAITMILENSINIAARRIYSSKCDYFVDAHIFAQKKTKSLFTNRVGAFS